MTDEKQLALAITRDPPPLSSFDIKHREQRVFLDTEATFTVIGSSHYVGAPELGYHELLSCKELTGDSIQQIPLREGHTARVSRALDAVEITTEIAVQPLSAFPEPELLDIAYRFGPEAYTTIDLLGAPAYETYHTYPEYDIAVRTETTVEPNTDAVSAEEAPHSIASAETQSAAETDEQDTHLQS
jgi:hypothetical protein